MKTVSSTRVGQLLCLLGISTTRAFSPSVWPARYYSRNVEVKGMFDGIKDAFSAEDADMAIDMDRETPFDRWMGINTKSSIERKKQIDTFVDSMAEENYLKVRYECMFTFFFFGEFILRLLPLRMNHIHFFDPSRVYRSPWA